jgi:hypothetical protein
VKRVKKVGRNVTARHNLSQDHACYFIGADGYLKRMVRDLGADSAAQKEGQWEETTHNVAQR